MPCQTEGTSQRVSPGSQQRSPLTPGTPDSVVADIHEDLSEDDRGDESKATRSLTPWGDQESETVLRRHR